MVSGTSRDTGEATPRRPGRPRANEANTSSTRETILNVALREFALNGFEGANLAEIARRADVAKTLVHYHFNNKESLWQAAVAHCFDDMYRQFENLGLELQDLDPAASLKVFLRKYVYFAAKRPELMRIILSEGPRGNDRARWLIENHIEPMHKLVGRFVNVALRSRKFKKLPVLNFISMLNGAISVYFIDALMLRESYGLDPADPTLMETHADIVVETILNGISRPEA